MLFNSFQFLIFFPLVVLLYYLTAPKRRWALLLIASYFFYMCWQPKYVLLVILSTVVDYFAAQWMSRYPVGHRGRKLGLYLSLGSNLGLLFFFKYFNFVNENMSALFAAMNLPYSIPDNDVLLPMGISFYTFQTLSYSIDVYRGRFEAEKHFGRFAVYVSFFPQLVAGPIERASHLLPQFAETFRFDYAKFVSGLKLILWGFFLKLVVADRLSTYVSAVYGSPEQYHGATVLLATYFFSFQIYADFAGYSTIAIGAARIMGFDLMDNFRHPYLATSIATFWKRWHISLSSWFQDYLYIPLGGNRCKFSRHLINLMIVFLVSGMWHGAKWTFLIWGGIHGALLILSILTKSWRTKLSQAMHLNRIPRIVTALQIFITFHLATLAWVFFRADSVSDAMLLLTNMAQGLPADIAHVIHFDARALYRDMVLFVRISKFEFIISILTVGFVMLHDCGREWILPRMRFSPRQTKMMRLAFYDLLIFCILLFGVFGQNQFLYFQF